MPPDRQSALVEIEQLAVNGNGVGYIADTGGERIEVEVPFTMPGDRIQAIIIGKKRGRLIGQLEAIVRPAPERQTSKCIHFGTCGGCRWQHIPYHRQLSIKEEKLKAAFCKAMAQNVEINTIIHCDPSWYYRNKADFLFSSDKSLKKFLGFTMEGGNHRVINIKECHLVNDWIVKGMHAVHRWWNESDLEAYHPASDRGSLRTVTFREGLRTGDRLVMLTVSGNPKYALRRHHLNSFVAFVRDAAEPLDPQVKLSIFLRIQQIVEGMETNFYEMHLEGSDHIDAVLHIEHPQQMIRMSIGPSVFFQPNALLAESLYSTAFKLANIAPDQVIYDLYCNAGTVTACLGKEAKQVVGIDATPEAALDARTNAAQNGVANATILSGSMQNLLKQILFQKEFPFPDVAFITSPREGMGSAACSHLLEMNPKKIISFSSNPDAQAREAAQFVSKGYRIEVIQPLDLFPQTPHCVSISIFQRI